MIPFSPPRIDQKVIDEVSATLQSGWITTGPKTKHFEREITKYTGCSATVAVNSWTMGMQVLLDWWGVKEGDEIILPAYTYCASANVILHAGAKPVLVDCNTEDFNLSTKAVSEAITPKTKAIIAVDIGGFPCDYEELYQIIEEKKSQFQANNALQKKLGRIALFADAAHSFGAVSSEKKSGILADVTCFSFHAVKNLTTAEGGAICFNLPVEFDMEEIYKHFCAKILHGQSKDALTKTKIGAWRYDVEEPGFKCNMTDIQAAIGLVEIARYQETLTRREAIFTQYDAGLERSKHIILPKYQTENVQTSFHLYQIRVKNATEEQRDKIIQEIAENGVAVNVHFQPLPLLTAYKKRGYSMENYPQAWKKYLNEISLPVYFDLTDNQVATVIETVEKAVNKIMQ